jgi:ribonuclease HI
MRRRKFTLDHTAALYCDGGVISKNPSTLGGTWAWRAVTDHGHVIEERSGWVAAPVKRPITNNHTEQIAITLALEAMPDGWSGVLYSDSMIALGRVFLGWRGNNLPKNIQQRSDAARKRLGWIDCILLKGHPNKSMLKAGYCYEYSHRYYFELQENEKRAACVFPVSEHNVWCDEACAYSARNFHESRLKEELQDVKTYDPQLANRVVSSPLLQALLHPEEEASPEEKRRRFR